MGQEADRRINNGSCLSVDLVVRIDVWTRFSLRRFRLRFYDEPHLNSAFSLV